MMADCCIVPNEQESRKNVEDSNKEKPQVFNDEDGKGLMSFRSEKVECPEPECEAYGTGKEVAIQTNAHEIERSSGQLPIRKRFVPLKFSDYCIFANNVKEEDEEEEDANFIPNEAIIKQVSNKGDKTKRSRGRPRKHVGKDSLDNTAITENEGNGGENMKKHSIVKVSNGFKCVTCGRIFSLRGNAKAHLITHTNDKPFKCDFKDCGRSLRTKESLRRHKLSHLGIKSFECTECKKKFSCNLSLQEHMALHTGEKPLSCDICGLKFRQIAVLKRHYTTHSNNKPFACEICGKRFSLKVYVRSHMKTHTGERPYTCDICNKCFAHASDLNRHKIIHSGKKPYECSVCSMRYSDPSSRRRHEREHQSKQQYVCHLCSQQFPRAGQLRVHLVKQHTTTAVDQQSLPFKVTVEESDGQEKTTSWDPTDVNNKLLRLQPNMVHAVSNAEVSGCVGEAEGIVETVQIVLDSSCGGQIGTGKGVASLSMPDDVANIDSSVQTMVMEIPRDAEQFTGLPAHGTYKIIDAGDGNQIFELQVEKESQVPFQDFSGEVKINLSDIKISDGLVAFIQDGDTVTVMEQPQTNGLLVQKNEEQESVVTKCIDETDSEKVMDVSDSIQEVPSIKKESSEAMLESSLVQHETSSSTEQVTDSLQLVERNDSIIPEMLNPSEMPTCNTSAITSDFIETPDLNSQDYYNWLSSFSEECKHFTMPLTKEIFQKISQVQKTLSDFMAMPTGVITDKYNFKILMSITQDLSQITTSHLSYMYSNLNNK